MFCGRKYAAKARIKKTKRATFGWFSCLQSVVSTRYFVLNTLYYQALTLGRTSQPQASKDTTSWFSFRLARYVAPRKPLGQQKLCSSRVLAR